MEITRLSFERIILRFIRDGNIGAPMAEVVAPIFRARENFSVSLIISSAFFARNSFDIEQNYSKKALRERCRKIPEEVRMFTYWAYGIGSVFSAVAFLEATINEFFLNAVEIERGAMGSDIFTPLDPELPLDPKVVESVAQIWNEKKAGSYLDFNNVMCLLTNSLKKNKNFCKSNSVDFWHILDKYQLALCLNHHWPFDTSSASRWDCADALIELRNKLVHYKSVWTRIAVSQGEYEGPEPEGGDIAKLENKLKDYKIHSNPLYPNITFPYNFLGWKGANWAVESSLEFSNEFFNWMGLKPPYDRLTHLLKTKNI